MSLPREGLGLLGTELLPYSLGHAWERGPKCLPSLPASMFPLFSFLITFSAFPHSSRLFSSEPAKGERKGNQGKVL